MIDFIDILPPSLAKDKNFVAIAKALSDFFYAVDSEKDKVLILPNIDKLNSDILDHLAVQWHVDYYSKDFPDDFKRKLIKDSLAWHRIKGTPAAVKKILDLFMAQSEIEEWFDYGGDPYFFRIKGKTLKDLNDNGQTFWNMLWDAKNVRSWLESLTLELDDQSKLEHAIMNAIYGEIIYEVAFPFQYRQKLETAIMNTFHGEIDFNYALEPVNCELHLHTDICNARAGELIFRNRFSDCNTKINSSIAHCIAGEIIM